MSGAKNSYEKGVISETPTSITSQQASLQKEDFDDLVKHKGYDVLYEKALKCPCRELSSGAASTNCSNCRATGWFFINRTSTRMVIQSINKPTKNQKWTEEDKGTIQITCMSADKMTFMDKIIILDVESTWSEVVPIIRTSRTNRAFSYLFYQPTDIEFVFMFNKPNEKLIPLVYGTDYIIDENKILLDNKLSNIKEDLMRLSVRYKHHPTYNVIDVVRETRKNRKKDCKEEDFLQEMPMNVVARKTHFMFDSPDFDGDSLFDNSSEQVSVAENPMNIAFQLKNNSPQQIYDALLRVGDSVKNNTLRLLLNG